MTELGIGSVLTTTLAQARAKAQKARELVVSGVNPITAKRDAKLHKASRHTFGECADKLVESKRSGWRSEKHAAQWRSTLETYRPMRSAQRPT